ncbi:MAG: AAA family ATPase [Kineosporiaceae bacterium]
MDQFEEQELRQGARLLRAVLDRFLGAEPDEPEGELLITRLEAHLGARPMSFPVVTAAWAPHEQADVQLALERWLEDEGLPFEIIGISHPMRRHQSLSELLYMARHDPGLVVSPPDLVHVPVSPDATHRCVAFGCYLVGGTPPLAMLLRGPDAQVGREALQLEILSADPDAAGELVGELRRLGIELSPVRGQIVTLAPPDRPGGSPIAFLRRPQLTRDRLVLPEATLAAVERQVLDVADVRPRLLEAGQHLKRGLLLYGPPGTGKTHTVRYLLGRLQGTTAVILSGTALHLVAAACQLARRHQPSVVVLEDVDLVAGDRSYGPPGANPLLFEVLNQLDGLGDDVDVVFVLTTNRVEVLERALAERPGRVDEAVEVGPPDAGGRERLLRLYGGDSGLADLDLDAVVAATDGVTATYLRELARRAVTTAALARPGASPVAVRQEDLETAARELRTSRSGLTRALLGADRGITTPPGPYAGPEWFSHGPRGHIAGGPFPGPFPVEQDHTDARPAVPPGWEEETP